MYGGDGESRPGIRCIRAKVGGTTTEIEGKCKEHKDGHQPDCISGVI